MKYVLIILITGMGFISCTKPVDKIQTTEKKKVYYRIKQVDVDGKVSYSPVVYVVEEVKK